MSIVDVLRKVAPSIAGALGGPAGAIARSVLASVLGVKPDASDEDIKSELAKASPEVLLKITEADHQYALGMEAHAIERDKLEQADRANARQRETDSHDVWTPRAVSLVVLAMAAFAVGKVFSGHFTTIKDPLAIGLIGTIVGYVFAEARTVTAYWLGTSFGSRTKDATIAKSLSKAQE